MPFKIKKLESGKYGLYNTKKKEMAKREFLTKESAEKMAKHYETFSQGRKRKPVEKTEESPPEYKEEDSS